MSGLDPDKALAPVLAAIEARQRVGAEGLRLDPDKLTPRHSDEQDTGACDKQILLIGAHLRHRLFHGEARKAEHEEPL